MNTSSTASTIALHHWIVAAMLAALVCGASFGEEAKVETNDQKLLALCNNPEATPEAIEVLLKAGANIEARDEDGKPPLMKAAGFGVFLGVRLRLTPRNTPGTPGTPGKLSFTLVNKTG